MSTRAAVRTDSPDRSRGALRRTLPAALPLLICLVVAAMLPLLVGPYYQEVGYRVLQLAALATAWNLMAGYGGLVSLGSAAFIGLGAYAAAESGNRWGLGLGPGLLLAGLVAGAFAIAVSPAMFRLRGLYFTIGTLALAEALRLLMINLQTFGGASGIVLQTPALETYQLYWWALGIALLATLVVVIILASPASLSLRGVRDDEDVAKQMGVYTFGVKLGVFVVAAFLMGMVGGLQATKLGVIEPYGSFGLSWSVDIVAVAIIGGLATRVGPWVGAVFYVVLAEALRDYPEIHVAITGIVLVLVIRFAPTGIWGSALRLNRRKEHGHG
jgi:branched-chain amino acid transport system permease protein